MSTSRPSFLRRTVSSYSSRSSSRGISKLEAASPLAESMIEIGLPIISSAEYPNSRSAPLFQLTTIPSGVSRVIASEEFTMASSCSRAASTVLMSWMSVLVPNHLVTSPPAFRTGTARVRNHRYSPRWRRKRNSASKSLPAFTASFQVFAIFARSSGCTSAVQPKPSCSISGIPVYCSHRGLR